MKSKRARRRIEVNLEELDRIIDHGSSAPLSQADTLKLKVALHALADRLTQERSTEKTSAVLKQLRPESVAPAHDSTERAETAPAGHERNGAGAFVGATRVSIPHATLQPGHACPECGIGKVYRQKEPATLVRIVGQASLQTTVFEMERLRCNACGEVFTAAAPESAGGDKYVTTEVAMIALLKYGTSVPFKRLERLENQLAMPLPAATQWELMAAAAKLLRQVLRELIRQAAQGSVVHNDGTGMRILQLTREPGDTHTGVFTNGIVSIVGAHRIALFFHRAETCGRKHCRSTEAAGEWIAGTDPNV